MAFWSTEKFLAEQKSSILVSEFDENRLKYGRYYLKLGRDILITPDGSNDSPLPGEGTYCKIPPGQIALLFTHESIQVPHNAMGFISVRTTEKIKGLVNISGFHVDPGFKGHLQFSVYNAGSKPIYLDYERECFLLWFCDLVGPTHDSWTTEDTWDKKNRFQKSEITAIDRERMSDALHSPGALHNRIRKLEDYVSAIIAVGGVIIFPLLIAVGVVIFDKSFGETSDKPSIIKLVVGTSLITSFIIAIFFVCIAKFRNRRPNR